MSDASPSSESLRRSLRRWKVVAVVSCLALAVSLTVAALLRQAVVEAQRQREAAETALREAQADAEKAHQAEKQARRRAEMLLYAQQISLAQRAWENAPQAPKK